MDIHNPLNPVEAIVNKMICKSAVGGVIGAALLAASSAFAACGPADINGTAMAPDSYADRTINVTPDMKSLNVSYGEIVRFVMQDGSSLVWKFDGIGNKLSLGTLQGASASAGSSAPMGTAGGGIPIYVDQGRNPLNAPCGGSGD